MVRYHHNGELTNTENVIYCIKGLKDIAHYHLNTCKKTPHWLIRNILQEKNTTFELRGKMSSCVSETFIYMYI
jgi:hypothetical protein